jgi:hypothetical protein
MIIGEAFVEKGIQLDETVLKEQKRRHLEKTDARLNLQLIPV